MSLPGWQGPPAIDRLPKGEVTQPGGFPIEILGVESYLDQARDARDNTAPPAVTFPQEDLAEVVAQIIFLLDAAKVMLRSK